MRCRYIPNVYYKQLLSDMNRSCRYIILEYSLDFAGFRIYINPSECRV